MTFRCERFRGRWETESDYAMNIRILKLKEDQVIDFKFPIRCFIIFYCPFCGADLLRKYSDEKYVNENGEIIRTL